MTDPQRDAVVRRMIELTDEIVALFGEDDTVHVIAQAVGAALADEAKDFEDLMKITSMVTECALRSKQVDLRVMADARIHDDVHAR
jgi:hypothetical protein